MIISIMYAHHSKEEWLKILNLPENYRVDAIIIDGHYAFNNRYPLFLKALKQVRINYVFEKFEDDFLHSFVKSLVLKPGDLRIWYSVFYGGAALSEIVHIASILGSRLNLLRGDVGALHPALERGDILIPSYSHGNESSTRLYARGVQDLRFYSTSNLHEVIVSLLRQEGLQRIFIKPTTTCQAMLQESIADIQNWAKQGFWGVEMEASTLFAVSNYFNIPVIAVLLVVDNLVKNQLVTDKDYWEEKEYRDQLRIKQYKSLLHLLFNLLQ